ncbi:hypothetical protein [Advenella faeciporci]|nr:hypothetical protein [Advenella faeciporci]
MDKITPSGSVRIITLPVSAKKSLAIIMTGWLAATSSECRC